MKEATGELNMSLVVISAIAGLSAFFFGWLWPNMQKNQEYHSACSHATCEVTKDASGRIQGVDDDGYATCKYDYTKRNGKHVSGTTKCKYKG